MSACQLLDDHWRVDLASLCVKGVGDTPPYRVGRDPGLGLFGFKPSPEWLRSLRRKVHPVSYLDRHPFLLEKKEARVVSPLFLSFQTDQNSDVPR